MKVRKHKNSECKKVYGDIESLYDGKLIGSNLSYKSMINKISTIRKTNFVIIIFDCIYNLSYAIEFNYADRSFVKKNLGDLYKKGYLFTIRKLVIMKNQETIMNDKMFNVYLSHNVRDVVENFKYYKDVPIKIFTENYDFEVDKCFDSVCDLNSYITRICKSRNLQLNSLYIEKTFHKIKKQDVDNDILEKYKKVLKEDWMIIDFDETSKDDTISSYNALRQYEKDIKYIVNNHKTYKSRLALGYLSGMTVVFWLPFIIGFLYGLFNYGIDMAIGEGIGAVLLFSFTTPVTLPLSFVWACIIKPKLIYDLTFSAPSKYKHMYIKNMPQNYKHCAYDTLLEEYHIDDDRLNKNSATVLAGTLISKFL